MKSYSDNRNYIRFVSPERAVRQILNHLLKYPNTDYVRIDDANISLNRNWLKDFCTFYNQNIQKPFMCQTRIHPSFVDDEIIAMLKDSGCFLIIFGVEHGSQEYRKSILKRNMSDDHIISTLKLCKKYKLATRVFVMFGTPYETVDLMLETIKLTAKGEAFDLSSTLFYPFPQTDLDDICKKEGFKISDSLPTSWPFAVLEQPSVTKDSVYFIWRMSRFLLLIYSLCYKGLSSHNGMDNENIIDDLVKTILDRVEGRMTESLFEKLTKYDELAHKIYKTIFHAETIAGSDLLLRI